jgi:hypothetical protein
MARTRRQMAQMLLFVSTLRYDPVTETFYPPPSMKGCPGDGARGCLVSIPTTKDRCQFCERTIELSRGAVIP